MPQNPFEEFVGTLDLSGIDGATEEEAEDIEQRDRLIRIAELQVGNTLDTLAGSSETQRNSWRSGAIRAIQSLQSARPVDSYDRHGPVYHLTSPQVFASLVMAINLCHKRFDNAAGCLASEATTERYCRNIVGDLRWMDGETEARVSQGVLMNLMIEANYVYAQLNPVPV